MVKNPKLLSQFERTQLKREKLTYLQSLKIVEALWEEGKSLGVLPPKNPLEGIETDIKLARTLNRCSSNSL
jgi:hypothetical protein